MADEIVSLEAPAELRDHARLMLERMARQVMEEEVTALCGAGYGARAESRSNSRNGYRDRVWDTRLGSLSLEVPRVREGSYFPSFLEPRSRAERAMASVIQEAYLQGVSTRRVDELVKALGGSGMSKSQVSRLCQEVQALVDEFLARPLEGEYPYVWLDATYVKARSGGRVLSRAAVVAVGLSAQGKREVLGLRVGDSESEAFWTEFLRDLRSRGLRGVRLVTSDAHAGLVAAVGRCLSCSWQRCRVHLMRNLLACVPKGKKETVAALVRTAFAQENSQAAKEQWRQVASGLERSLPSVASRMKEAEADALAFMDHPREIWPMAASNNGLERLNKELKRRANVVQIFPGDDAVRRLFGAILMEQHDEWQVARRQISAAALGAPDTKNDAILARGAGG